MKSRNRVRTPVAIAFPSFLLLALSSCAPIGIQDQGLLAKPNMQFNDSPVGNADGALLSQIEPGSTGGGGSQATGCVACR